MKVAIDLTFLRERYGGGKEEFVNNLLKGFSENGQGAGVLLMAWPERVSTLRESFPDSKIISIEIRLPGWIKNTKKELIFRSMLLPRILREEKADVMFFPVGYSGFRKIPLPTVINTHDIQFVDKPWRTPWHISKLIRFLYGVDFWLRDRIIAISKYDQKVFQQHFPQYRSKSIQIYNPIIFSDESWKPQKDPGYILAVNVGYPHKNTKTLLEAFEILAKKVPQDLILVGNSYMDVGLLEQWIALHPYKERIHWKGFVSRQELEQLYSQCSVYVTPSLYEGFGMTAVEALGMGIPVVASRETAIPEATREMARYYEPTQDHKALAEAVFESLTSPPSIEQRERAKKEMRQSYDYRVIAESYWSLFEGLVESK